MWFYGGTRAQAACVLARHARLVDRRCDPPQRRGCLFPQHPIPRTASSCLCQLYNYGLYPLQARSTSPVPLLPTERRSDTSLALQICDLQNLQGTHRMPTRGEAVTLALVRRKRSSNEVTRSCRCPPAAKGQMATHECFHINKHHVKSRCN
jgi:hypothetical protein